MNCTMTRPRLPWTFVMVCALAGCSVAGPRSSPLPHDGPTMIDIYKKHMQEEMVGAGSARERLPARAADEDDDSPALQRTTLEPTVNRFQRLPNPDLEMHVYPHLANGKYPVPGYVTVFPMYESVQYAMPGEVPPRRSAPRSNKTSTAVTEAPTTLPDRPEALDALQALEKISPRWHQVIVDFRADYRTLCDGTINDQDTLRLLRAWSSNENLHDLQRRYAVLTAEESGRAYRQQRTPLACQDVARALSDLRVASK